MASSPDTVVVPVQSAWFSKINWTQAIGIIATVLTVVSGSKFNMPAETQATIVIAIQSIQSVVTWVLRTFVTASVTPSAVASVPPVTPRG